MELRLSQAVYQSYQDKGIELTIKQVESKLSDLIGYWAEAVIPDMVSEDLI